ncbi:MAG TPA: cupredoxin domain-containing protein [Actinomycetota bacterium]|jgi:plastocyanin|nr:cupredoxin domain-containing protein [Actinomycetota bacterium]
MTFHQRNKRIVSLAAVAVLGLGATACDGGGEPEVGPTQTEELLPTEHPTDEELGEGEDRTGRPRHEIELVDNEYRPDEVSVPAGEVVTFLLENTGDNGHTFTVEELDIDVELQFDQSSRVDVIVPSTAGEIDFVCRFHGEQGMRGTIFVEA